VSLTGLFWEVIVDMNTTTQRGADQGASKLNAVISKLRKNLTNLGMNQRVINTKINELRSSSSLNKTAYANNIFKKAKAAKARRNAANAVKAVRTRTKTRTVKSRTARPMSKPKTAVRSKTIVPKNALSTTQKKLIDQLDTLVGEMTRGNDDLHDFIISFYDETSNNEFTMKLFGGKSINEAKQIIQKHINLFSKELLRGSEVKETFVLKGDDVINFAYLMYLDMKHDATIPQSMTFAQYCKASWGRGGKQVRSPVYIMFGRELKPKRTDFIKKIEYIVNNATNTNGKKYGSMEKAIKYNLPTIYQDIPDMFKGVSVAYAQINEKFLKGRNNLFLALDQEDEKHTATLNISRTRYNIGNGGKAKLLYPFVSVANLLDPGKNMLIDSAKEDSKYLMNAATSNSSVVGNTAANRITSRLTWNYYKPKFVIEHDYGKTKIDVYYTKRAGPKRDKRGYAVSVFNPRSEEYRLEAKVSKGKASNGTSADKLSKFFGDFLQALSTINQIKKNKEKNVSNHNFCLTTGDAMLANMFVFMCSHGSPTPVTPKLWLVLSAQQRSFLYGMNDILQVASAAPTRVINVPNMNKISKNTNEQATSGSNRTEGGGNTNNKNNRGIFRRIFGGTKKPANNRNANKMNVNNTASVAGSSSGSVSRNNNNNNNVSSNNRRGVKRARNNNNNVSQPNAKRVNRTRNMLIQNLKKKKLPNFVVNGLMRSYDNKRKTANQIIREANNFGKTFAMGKTAQRKSTLREEYLAPQEDDETVVCEHCDLVRGESDYVECECDRTRMTQFAEEIGCDLS
jgi:hypothetical protein